MRKVKITVLKTTLDKELARESPYAAAMTDCGLSYSNWSPPARSPPWITSRSGKMNRPV